MVRPAHIEWAGVDERQARRHERNRACRRDHVLAIAAVVRDAGDLPAHAGEEIAAAALVAIAAVAAVPTHAHSLPWFPAGHTGADRVDHSGHFVTGDTRVLNPRDAPLFRDRIAMANAAGVDLDPHPAGTWLRDGTLHDIKRSARAGNLGNAHHGHVFCLRRRCLIYSTPILMISQVSM